MTINLRVPASMELHPKITVFGIGGAGGNAVTNMIKSQLEGVEFVVANTDAQALANNKAERKIQIGAHITQGLGAGARPEVGHAAAEESLDEIVENLNSSHMVFITAGMGGGTGTGAAPVIAKAARDQGILTVGVVTKPFQFEGARRMRIADQGIEELQRHVDTLIVIPNQNLFRIANEKTTFAEAFSMADEVLHCGVRGITDLMVMPGLINLDFADVRTVMGEMGKAMMGTGEASGEKRAIEAAEAAISNPLLDEVSMKGARGVLISITGGLDMTLFEVDEAANRIRSEVDPDANIIVGSTFSDTLEGQVRVSVVATGIEAEEETGHIGSTSTATAAASFSATEAQPVAPVQPTQPAPQFQRSAGVAINQPAPQPVRASKTALGYDAAAAVQSPEPVAETAGNVNPAEVNELIERARVFALSGQGATPSAAEPPRGPAEQDATLQSDHRSAPPQGARAQRRGMPGLLERVANSGRFMVSGRPQDEDAHRAAEIPEPAARAKEEPSVARRAPAAEQRPQAEKPAQEEDQLEIPAFLRRPA